MKTKERLSRLRNEIDELLSEVEKTPELNVILEKIGQLEAKFDKIDEIENRLKSKPEIESLVKKDVLEKIGEINSKIVEIREEVSTLKNQFTNEVKYLRTQMGNVVEAIVDLVKTLAPEIIKPETGIPLEPLKKIAEEKTLTTETTSPKVVSETVESTEEQVIIKTPTILTKLDKVEMPERFEEKAITKEPTEISEEKSLGVEERVKEPVSELDSFVSKEDEKILKELGLDMIEQVKEKRFNIPEMETTLSYVRLTNLETRKIKLEREINELKTTIQAGFGSLEDEKIIEEKIREKEEIEKQIRELENKR
jgi:hypothetical protein